MKISVVIPVYNEEAMISSCLDSLINQNYPKENYEIVVVNDGSTDSTLRVIKKEIKKAKKLGIELRCIDLEKNSGRIIARETGAKKAKFNNLLFIDSRCQADKNLLAEIKKIDYQPIVGNALIDKNKSIFDYFSWMFRKKLYYPYFGESFEPVYISKNNFDKIPKGTGVFFCDKNLFLDSQPKEKNKNVSDDTKLLRNIVEKKKILRHPLPKIIYISRNSIGSVIKHTYNRGPKFVDYYLSPGKKNFWLFIFFPIIFFIVLIFLFILFPIYIKNLIYILLILLFFASLFIADSLKGFFISIIMIPTFSVPFFIGILKGIFVKLNNK
ncbi:glycosyltransferase family 2 protein [Candidatus Shapirobacteria bacterium]|nr:glycosyltransferase family 2 protein [Candidatus Shapirobacteria bacterium]